MRGHELGNNVEHSEALQTSSFSALLPDLHQNRSFQQLSQLESSAPISKNGFPQLELVDSSSALMKFNNPVMKSDQAMKSDSPVRLSSKYETGNELTSDRELKQAGLNPKDVKHTIKKEDAGWTEETSTVKYPNGLEVTVAGRAKHMQTGHDAVMTPEATIKEPLPKGFHKDKNGAILDATNKEIAQINQDGTVTVKVGNGYLTQSPAGVTEATVLERKDGTGMLNRIPVKD